MKTKTKHKQRHNRGTESIQFARIQKLAVRQTVNSQALFFKQYSCYLQNLGITCIAYSFLPLHEMPDIFRHFMKCHPEGRRGMSDVFLLSGISGLSFDSPFLAPLLFCFSSAWSSCSFCLVIFLLMVHSSSFFFLQKTQIFFVKG